MKIQNQERLPRLIWKVIDFHGMWTWPYYYWGSYAHEVQSNEFRLIYNGKVLPFKCDWGVFLNFADSIVEYSTKVWTSFSKLKFMRTAIRNSTNWPSKEKCPKVFYSTLHSSPKQIYLCSVLVALVQVKFLLKKSVHFSLSDFFFFIILFINISGHSLQHSFECIAIRQKELCYGYCTKYLILNHDNASILSM